MLNRFVRWAVPLALCTAPALSVAPAYAARPGEPSPAKPRPPMGLTGAVDEEHFKALHELKQGQAPPLQGTTITIGGTRAYLSLPRGAKPPLPAVILVHEWWGLNDNIRLWADRLAADGYAALAVDLYGGVDAKTPDEAMAAMKKVDPQKALETLDAAYRFLAEAPTVKATKRAVLGWCFGGGWSLQFALHEPTLNAAVMYYGRLVTDPAALASLRAPLLGVFGNQDQSIPPAAVDEFESALKAAGRRVTIYRYDAPHAFANPSNPKYDEKAASDAWTHVRDFLAKNLS